MKKIVWINFKYGICWRIWPYVWPFQFKNWIHTTYYNSKIKFYYIPSLATCICVIKILTVIKSEARIMSGLAHGSLW